MNLSRVIRFTAMLLIPALLGNDLAFAAKKPIDPAGIKAKVQARGVGQGVRVTLADNTEATGLIVSIGEQSFALKAKKAAQPREIQYAQVTSVQRDKLTTGQKVIVGVVIFGVVVGVAAAIIVHKINTNPI